MSTSTSTTTHDFKDGHGEVPAHQHSNGGGWVADTATVADTAYVGESAKVYGNAQVSGNAKIQEHARVHGNAQVFRNAQVYGNAHVFGDAQVYGSARVYGDAKVSGNALVSGYAHVRERAQVYGAAQVSEEALISGCAKVFGKSKIYGDAKIHGKSKVYGDAQVYGSAEVYGDAIVTGNASVSGCVKILLRTYLAGDTRVFGNPLTLENHRSASEEEYHSSADALIEEIAYLTRRAERVGYDLVKRPIYHPLAEDVVNFGEITMILLQDLYCKNLYGGLYADGMSWFLPITTLSNRERAQTKALVFQILDLFPSVKTLFAEDALIVDPADTYNGCTIVVLEWLVKEPKLDDFLYGDFPL